MYFYWLLQGLDGFGPAVQSEGSKEEVKTTLTSHVMTFIRKHDVAVGQRYTGYPKNPGLAKGKIDQNLWFL